MKCINDPSRYYKGNESSPKGLGYCAFAEEIGKVMEGRDDMLYEVRLNIVGNKIWSKIGPKKTIKYSEDSKEYRINNSLGELEDIFDGANQVAYDDHWSCYDNERRKDFLYFINKIREEVGVPKYEKY
jgi:hypothetical protein